MKRRLFVDMDGTLAVFKKIASLEELYEKDYFLNLEPHMNVVDAVKRIALGNNDIEVYIMSSVLTDSKYALEEKNAWLDKYLPEIDGSHRIFPPCGEDKKEYVPGMILPSDRLLDDYTKNLLLWEPPARGIKLINGINNTNGTWKKDCLDYRRSGEELANNIVEIIKYGRQIRDGAVSATLNGEQPGNEVRHEAKPRITEVKRSYEL